MVSAWTAASAQAIAKKAGVDTPCAAFIDGTVRPISRPTYFQRQAVVLANGLIISMYGPIEGRRHDVILLKESGVGQKWLSHACPGTYVYGDPAYPLRPWLISPYKGARLTSAQASFNKKMNSVRVSVEWCFAGILRDWAFLNYKKNLKVFLSPVAKMYLIGVLLSNCIACTSRDTIVGNQTSQFFNLAPPSLENYLKE
ncbi:hypothetical protein Ae201684P_015975 [Aphanomyces euteiches]|nr:hypothetical protein Ae201684P_015975 [Aphanomyces euteiches]